jgi:ankyrin repeat protein
LDVNATDSSGATPLMLAALIGNVQVMVKLVDKGAKLNTQDSANGWTALMQVFLVSVSHS